MPLTEGQTGKPAAYCLHNTAMSRQQTTLLIVGAGPTGLAMALSLVKHGFQDFVIVDTIVVRPPSSRAMTIHAATLEVRLSLGVSYVCVESLPGPRFD